MCHTPSSDDENEEAFLNWYMPEQDDEPTEPRIESVITPHGIWQILPPQPLPDPVELTDEERREAAQRYIDKHFGGLSLTEWQKRVIDQIMELHDKDPEAFRRERLSRWTSNHIHDDDGTVEGCPGCFPGTSDEVKRRLAKGVGIYNQMIHRAVDGSDPLVEEPGP
jgi:hypothetical protein